MQYRATGYGRFSSLRDEGYRYSSDCTEFSGPVAQWPSGPVTMGGFLRSHQWSPPRPPAQMKAQAPPFMRGRPSAATDKSRCLGLPGKTCGFHSRITDGATLVEQTELGEQSEQAGTRQDRPRLAERAGFEPAEPFGSRALQARALGRTMLPLLFVRRTLYHPVFRLARAASLVLIW